MIRYVCTKKCYHGRKLYRVGDYANFRDAKDGPHDKKGALIHFEPVEDGSPLPEKAKPRKTGAKVNEKDV
jgi:hypothetical protein